MTIELAFYVQKGNIGSRPAGMAYIEDAEIFAALLKVATEHFGLRFGSEPDSIAFNALSQSPYILEAFDLLRRAGWTPFYGEFIPDKVKGSRFDVRRLRKYEKKDFDAVDCLTVHRWGNWERIFVYDGMAGGLYKGKVDKAKWGSRYGITDNARSPRFVNDELKGELEAAKLAGLTFLPVLWDNPAKAKGQFWQISSSITMPRCLLPILEVPETQQPWTTYDDGGHFPQELVFRLSEVKAIESFDVALTAPEEEIHCGPHSWPRMLVVSQRFRQVTKKLKLTTAELIPARLVADDWQRPLSDHDRLAFESAL